MRIAAVGDSVNWGQGLKHPTKFNALKDEEKYIFKIVEWLQDEGIAQPMDRADFRAHSGAIIGTDSDVNKPATFKRENSKDPNHYDLYYGEIPDDYPTILGQLKQIKDSQSVDLLFINGGANDVGILESIKFEPTFRKVLTAVDTYAKERVSILLKEARKTCPNAIIVYTGYYPGLSSDSDIPLSTMAILKDLEIVPSLAYLVYIHPLAYLLELFVKTQLPRIKNQGVIFHKRMLGKFREQIAEFNSNRDPQTPPILFSPSGFSASNAMFATNQYVTPPDSDPNKTVGAARKKLCGEVPESLSGFMCTEAYVAHPNAKGASKYFSELKKRLEKHLNFSLREHLEGMDPTLSSINQFRDKYKFAPADSLRGLTDVLWLDSVTIDYELTIIGLEIPIMLDKYGNAVIDTGEVDPNTKRYDEMMRLENTIQNGTMLVDFGFNQGFETIKYYYNPKVIDNYTIDLYGNERLSNLQYIEIRLPQYYELLMFTLDMSIKINGYKFKTLKLDKGSFLASREKNGPSPKYYYHRIVDI